MMHIGKIKGFEENKHKCLHCKDLLNYKNLGMFNIIDDKFKGYCNNPGCCLNA